MTFGFALAVLIASAIGASLGQQTSMAQWVGFTLFGVNLIAGWLAYRTFGGSLSRLLQAIATPVLLGGVVWWVGWGLLQALSST